MLSIDKCIKYIKAYNGSAVNLMEVCGTHTMSIARAGIKEMLPENVRLLSGPGCPVCVTEAHAIDEALNLSERSDVIIATYGDMVRVPGSRRGDSLMKRRAMGARVEIVYSPMDAVRLASECASGGDKVVFLGVGFETTAPGTAASVLAASENGVDNYLVYSMLKRLEPSVKALAKSGDFNVQGFLCPGHVAVITGESGMRFFESDLHVPAVISGFEADDIILSIAMLLRQLECGEAKLQNEYTPVVSRDGNTLAMEMMASVLEVRDDDWRGLGRIKKSGYGLNERYAPHDAERVFGIGAYGTHSPCRHLNDENDITALCRCGDVIRGVLASESCPMFGTVCTPDDPLGPCMVSSEGACAAAYKYGGIRDI